MILQKKIKNWGYYRDIIRLPFFALKLLVFNKDSRLSLQAHEYRNELWFVLSGYGYALYKQCHCNIRKNKYSFYWIPRGARHKFKTASKECLILEIQFGLKVSEKDIKRYDND